MKLCSQELPANAPIGDYKFEAVGHWTGETWTFDNPSLRECNPQATMLQREQEAMRTQLHLFTEATSFLIFSLVLLAVGIAVGRATRYF